MIRTIACLSKARAVPKVVPHVSAGKRPPLAGSRLASKMLRESEKARRAGWTRLPLAGDELMASSKLDPEIVAHLEWIGFVRPTGLVVSAPARKARVAAPAVGEWRGV
jgi:hypothetical protein